MTEEVKQPESPTKALTIQDQAMPLLPSREFIKEMGTRLRFLVKNGDKLQDEELWSLAVTQYSTGLNAVTGEIWYIPGKGIMVGIAGLTKRMNALAEENSFTWFPDRKIARPDDYMNYSIPDNAALAYICEIRRSDLTKQYTDTVKDMKEAMGTLTYEQMIDLFGRPPVISGAGWVTEKEVEDYKKNPSTMPPDQKAWKRARASALKQLITIPTAAGYEGDRLNGGFVDSDDWIVEGKVVESGQGDTKVIPFPASDPKPEPEPIKVPDRPADPPALRVYFKSLVAASKVAGIISQNQSKAMLSLIAKMVENDKAKRHILLFYIGGEEDIKKWTGAMASAFIEIFKDPDPESWELHGHALVEVERILKQHAEDQGQMTLFEDQPEPAKDTPKPEPKPAPKTKKTSAAKDQLLDSFDEAAQWLKARKPDSPDRACRWLKDRLSLNWSEDTCLAETSSELGIKPSEVDITIPEHWHALIKAAVGRARI